MKLYNTHHHFLELKMTAAGKNQLAVL